MESFAFSTVNVEFLTLLNMPHSGDTQSGRYMHVHCILVLDVHFK